MNIYELMAMLSLDTKGYEKGLEDSESKGKKASGNIGKALKTVWKVGAAAFSAVATGAGFFAKSAIDAGRSYEAQMSKVQAISGATGEEFDKLKAKALEMGGKTKFSASEAGQAFEYMAMAGWKTGDMLDGIEGIMNLAAASGEDLARTSDIVTDALTAFGLSAADSGHFADVLAVASSNANTNVGMMGETFKYVAPVAGALGYSAEDTAVAIGLMANSGIKASQAGTSLRSIMSRMADPTDKVQAAMDSLGVSLTNEDGTMRSLNEVMIDLRAGFANLSEAEKSQMASALAGKNAMSGLLAIVGASDSDFEKLTTAINDADGTCAEMAATMQNNLNGAIDSFKSRLETLQITFYETFSDKAKTSVNMVADALAHLTEGFNEGGLAGLTKALQDEIGKLSIYIAKEAPKVVVAIGQLTLAIVTGIASSLPQISQIAYDMAISLIEGLTNGLRGNVSQFLSMAMPMVLQFAEQLHANANQLISAGLKMIEQLAYGIIDSLPVLIATVPGIVQNIADIINDNAPKLLASGVKIIAHLILGLIQSIPSIVAAIPQIIMAIVSVITAFAWIDLGKTIVKGISDGIKALTKEAGNAMKKVYEAVYNAIKQLPTKLKSLATNGVSGLKSTFSSAVGALRSVATNILNAIVNALKTLPSKLMQLAKQGVEKIKSAFKVDWKSVGSNVIKGIVSGITGGLGSIASAAKKAASTALKTAKAALGIHSPSRVFRDQIGQMISEGMALGIENDDSPEKALLDKSKGLVASASLGLDGNVSGSFGGGDKSLGEVLAMLRFYLPKLANMKVILDDGTLVGKMASGTNEELDKLRRLELIGAI